MKKQRVNSVFRTLTYEAPKYTPVTETERDRKPKSGKTLRQLSEKEKSERLIRENAVRELREEKNKRRALVATNREEYDKYKEETKDKIKHLHELTRHGLPSLIIKN